MKRNEHPKFFGHEFRLTWYDIIVSAVCVVIGFVLAIYPEITQDIILTTLGVLTIIGGLACVVRYAMLELNEAMDSHFLVNGLIAIAGGIIFIVLKPLLVTLLPVMIGFFILYCGVTKLHYTLNFKRMNSSKWYLELINACISIAFGLINIIRPFTVAYTLMRFMGIGLIFEGILDFISMFIYYKARREYLGMR